jgi:chemotaxis protein methyltransferase CheR
MPALDLTPSVFAILSSLIEERAGLHYEPRDRDLLGEKASVRAREAGFESLLDYYYYLRYDPGGEHELLELVETLVVPETYFFREWPAIQVLVDAYIAPWCRAGRRPRIWSAACATGEEPLSLAMLLDARGLLDTNELWATDISARALAKGQRGRFGKRAIRQVPEPQLVDRYLRADGDGYTVSSRLIDAIHWQPANLLVDDGTPPGVFDVILCRNVLIYFSDHTVRAVLQRLARTLTDDGVLLVGISESLLRYGGGFAPEERGGAFFYRKVTSS